MIAKSVHICVQKLNVVLLVELHAVDAPDPEIKPMHRLLSVFTRSQHLLQDTTWRWPLHTCCTNQVYTLQGILVVRDSVPLSCAPTLTF